MNPSNNFGKSVNFEFTDAQAVSYSRTATTATAVGTITAGVQQVETATIVGTIGASGAGDVEVIVTAAGMSNSPKTVNVAVANNDTAAQVAGKIRTDLAADPDVSAFFTVSGADENVVLTAITAAANDATMNIAYDNGTASGLTPDATSTDTTAGVASGAGNATVTITSSVITGSPLAVSVAVGDGDTAATWAGKVRTALAATLAVVEHYYVSGATDKITLTKKDKKTADATLNIALADGTSDGITEDATSDSTGSYSALARYPGGGVLKVNDAVSRVVNVRLIGMAANTSIQLTVTGPIIIPTNENPAKVAEVIETSTTATDMTMFY